MNAIFIFVYFVLEFKAISWVWQRFGAVNTLFAFLLSAIFGIGILRNQGRYMLAQVQTSVARGLTPGDPILHGCLIFASGLFFLIPGFVSDIIGFLLLLPGSRHALVRLFKRWLGRRIERGEFGVFSSRATARATTGEVRDVSPQVIDVSPISVESHETSEEDNR